MSTNVIVQPLGESITEGTISKWYKKAGDTVKADEIIAEIETDKVTMEVNAPVSGTISKILKNEGEVAAVKETIAIIDDNQSDAKKNDSKEKQPTEVVSTSPDQVKTQNVDADNTSNKLEKEKPEDSENKKSGTEEKILSPAAQKIAAENKVQTSQISGTGKDKRVTKHDVLNFIEESAKQDETSSENYQSSPKKLDQVDQNQRETEKVRMSRLRQTIAKRLKDSQNTAAILSTFNEVDMSSIIAMRKKYKDTFEKKYGVKLGFMSFFVKAVIEALQQFPIVNAEINGEYILYKHYCDIGIAVGTESGLVVPILRNAETMNFVDIEQEIVTLSSKAREGKLTIDDLSGGTFTITNGGTFGSLLSTPIINPPQSGILGMHKIQERAVVIDGEIKVRPMMYLALSYDHRIIDGRDAVLFLTEVKGKIEQPERLLLGI